MRPTRPPTEFTGNSVMLRSVFRSSRTLAPGAILIVVFQLCAVSVPALIGVIVDRAVSTGRVSDILIWVAVLAATFIVLTTTYQAGARLLMYSISHEAHCLRNELSAKILSRRGIRTEKQPGELLSIATSDADMTSTVLDHIPRILSGVVATVACGAILLTIDTTLGLIILLGIPVVVALLQSAAPAVGRRVAAQQQQIGLTSALATDLVSGLRPIQGIGAQGNAANRYRESSRTALTAALRAARTRNLQTGLSAAAGSGTAMGVAIVAAYFALSGDLSIGALITAVGLAQFLIDPITQLATAPSWISQSRAAADRVADVLNSPAVEQADPAPTEGRPVGSSLHLTSITHGSLEDFSLAVEPGEFVAIATQDGRDASALIEVLANAGHGTTGDVRVGGVRIDTVAHGERRSALLVQRHHSDLFTGTLESNIRFAVDLQDDLQPALTASSATEVVALHPEGLNHLVEDRGANLSGGQRQRLTLARALAAQPAVLVLHDPTTAVDTVTEQAIAAGIREVRTGSPDRPGEAVAPLTTVVITTSPALLAVADRVVLVESGRTIAQGSHAQMLEAHDNYRDLVIR